MLIELLRDHSVPDESAPSELVKQAQAILQDCTLEDLSIEKVAESLSVSSVWLSKKFRQEVGESPAKWARSQRVHKAKRQLMLGQRSVGEIAFELGFSSSQYFSTVFRQETGLTPTEYRHSRMGLIEQ